MTSDDRITRIQRRLGRVERRLRAADYPAPTDLSYVAEVDGLRAFFLTDEPYSNSWFYPRYAGGKLHEPAATAEFVRSLRPGSVFVDVGAHLGFFSVLAGLRARRVFAVEPQEFLIGRIHRNVAANHLDNVALIHAAAGAAPGFARLPKTGDAATRPGMSDNLVPVIRLDDYFSDEFRPTHLKIDVEGFELDVLRGAARILESRPLLLIELHEEIAAFGHEPADLWDLLAGAGYRIRRLAHRGAGSAPERIERAAMAEAGNAMLLCDPG
jgi:FkbM family methyltransferase